MLDDQFEKGQAPVIMVLVRINSRQFRKILELNEEFGFSDKPVDETILELLDIGLKDRMAVLAQCQNDE